MWSELPLPIDGVIPRLRSVLAEGGRAVLQAPPGAGKTTRVPLAFLGEPWLAGRRIVMLEPHRLAARAAALRMGVSLDEPIARRSAIRCAIAPRRRADRHQ